MNIFYLDKDPVKAARLQYNKHVVKMILESAQMLCTAHRCHSLADEVEWVPYKKAHVNHPSTIWARQSANHYLWLYYHMLALGDEYTKRYGKTHLSITKCAEILSDAPRGMRNKPFEQPPQCMPDEYKDKCSVQAYWNYYIGEKHSVANPKTEKIWTKDLD